jgi:hypothetical protein
MFAGELTGYSGVSAHCMPDTIFFDFLHPARVPIHAGPEGLLAVRLMEWARVAGLRGLIHVARSETRAQRLVRALRGLAPQLELLMLPPWDCLPYGQNGCHPSTITAIACIRYVIRLFDNAASRIRIGQ